MGIVPGAVVFLCNMATTSGAVPVSDYDAGGPSCRNIHSSIQRDRIYTYNQLPPLTPLSA